VVRHLNPPEAGLPDRAVSAHSFADRSTRSPGFSERVTHVSNRYLLPFVGVGAAALGTLLLSGVAVGARPYLPWSLLALGGATVASSAAYHHWQIQRRASSVPPPASPPAVASPFPAPAPSRIISPPPPVDRARWMPHSGIGRAALSATDNAGDRMWGQWQTPHLPSLGVALAGPVPETAYVPPPTGRPGAFPARDRDLVLDPSSMAAAVEPVAVGPDPVTERLARRVPVPVVRSSSHGRARLASRRRVPYTPAELDALFPPETALTPAPPALPLVSGEISPIPFLRPTMAVEPEAVGLGGAPSATGGGSAPRRRNVPDPARSAGSTASMSVDHPTGRFRILPTLLALHNPLYVETIHPIPPHLRPLPAGRASTSSARTSSSLPRPSRTVCVGCLRTLYGFRSWVLCPGCHEPLCRRCLGASFLASSEGYCSGCRPWHVRPPD
jgi:hypothetical protein